MTTHNMERDTTPLVFMGVKINPEWADDFHALATGKQIGSQDLINWIIDGFFKGSWDWTPLPEKELVFSTNERSVKDLPVTSHKNERIVFGDKND